jgi:hypothetical protein
VLLLHVDYKGTTMKGAHTEEVDIPSSVELLRRLRGMSTLR